MENLSSFSDHDVRVRAYRIWMQKGKPKGRAEAYWREALVELKAEVSAESGAARMPVASLNGNGQSLAFMSEDHITNDDRQLGSLNAH